MRYAYPYVVHEPDETNRILVDFPDVPEAHDDGADATEAIEGAAGSLVAALQGYVELKRDIPPPSKPRRGQGTIALPALVAAKVELYRAVRERGLTNVALSKLLGMSSESDVRRLLDLEHASRMAQVENALAALGRELVVEGRVKAA
ncbi:MAG: type II toxin-antitoxin system HicB family antitoxin [Alphaproteobacteria bacterium]